VQASRLFFVENIEKLNVLIHKGFQLIFRNCAHLCSYNNAVLYHEQGRDGADSELIGYHRGCIGVQLCKLDFACIFGGDSFYYRSDVTTWTAPRSPEIHQRRNIGFHYFSLKVAVVYFQKIPAHFVLLKIDFYERRYQCIVFFNPNLSIELHFASRRNIFYFHYPFLVWNVAVLIIAVGKIYKKKKGLI